MNKPRGCSLSTNKEGRHIDSSPILTFPSLFQGQQQQQQLMYPASTSGGFHMVAPLSAAVPAVAASQQLSHGIRQVRTTEAEDSDFESGSDF